MFRVNIYGPLDGGIVILQLYSKKVFTQRNFVADCIRFKLNFIKKTKNCFMSHRLGELWVTYAHHL